MFTSTRHGVRQPTSVTLEIPAFLAINSTLRVYTTINCADNNNNYTRNVHIRTGYLSHYTNVDHAVLHLDYALPSCTTPVWDFLPLSTWTGWIGQEQVTIQSWLVKDERLQHVTVAQTLERMWCSTWFSTWCSKHHWLKIDQFRYIKIQPKTIELSTRHRGITTEFVGFISQSLVIRPIVLGCILIYRNWAAQLARDHRPTCRPPSIIRLLI